MSKKAQKAPNCYDCKHRRNIHWDCHSMCANQKATVRGHEHGIANGWFNWPVNFDPTWLQACNGFEPSLDGAANDR